MYGFSYSCIHVHAIRLINRGLYPLAMEICKYLKIPPANGEVKILKEWALRKVRTLWYYNYTVPEVQHACTNRYKFSILASACFQHDQKCFCWKCTEVVVICACMSDLL